MVEQRLGVDTDRGGHESDAEVSLLLPDCFECSFGGRDGRARLAQESFSRESRFQGMGGAVDEFDTDFAFETADLLCQCRGG